LAAETFGFREVTDDCPCSWSRNIHQPKTTFRRCS